MSQKNKSNLKKMFVSLAIPTESNFSDLIDSSQSTLVAGDNISLTSQSDGSVKIDANVSNNGIITTFKNNNELATVIESFLSNSTPGIAVYTPINGSAYIGTWDFKDMSAPLGTIVIIQETRNSSTGTTGLTLNGLGTVRRTQRVLPVKIGTVSSMTGVIIIKTFKAWEIVGSVGEVQAAN